MRIVPAEIHTVLCRAGWRDGRYRYINVIDELTRKRALKAGFRWVRAHGGGEVIYRGESMKEHEVV